MMEISLLVSIVAIAFAVLCVGLFLRSIHQPYVIAYIVVGVLLGPQGIGLITDTQTLSHLGELGILLLMFFVGMHVSLPKLFSNWKVPIIGTLGQISLSVALIWYLSRPLSWPMSVCLLLGFVITLSSTAVVLKMLEEWNELKTKVGQNVLGILIVQDMAVIPMLIILGFSGAQSFALDTFLLQLVGGIVIILFVWWMLLQKDVHLPFAHIIRKDHEMQVFVALILCFGFALFTSLFQLSSALGAFLAGIVIASTKDTDWVRSSLQPFQVIFVAFFFIYVGILLDFSYLIHNWIPVFVLVFGILIINTCINALVLWFLGDSIKESFYAGALLAQVGEFSLLLGAIGLGNQLITKDSYQLIVLLISLSMLLSPFWVMFTKRVLHIDASYAFEQVKKILR